MMRGKMPWIQSDNVVLTPTLALAYKRDETFSDFYPELDT